MASARGPDSRSIPIPPTAGGVAGATMVKTNASRPGHSWDEAIGAASTALLAARRLAPRGAFHLGAVFFDVFLHRPIVELKIAQDTRVHVPEGGGFLVAPQPKAHLEHRSAEQS